MTVSRVFRSSPRVAPETRRKVLDIAQEVGYQPNQAARALRRGQSNLIGFLSARAGGFGGQYHADALVTLESAISQAGHNLMLLMPKAQEPIFELLHRVAVSNNCRALVTQFDTFPEEELRPLRSLSVPVIVASKAPAWFLEKYGLSSVGFDNAGGVVRAVRHLYTLGHRRIAYIGGTEGWVDSIDREHGYRQAMAELNLELVPRWMKACPFRNGYAGGRARLNELLSSGVDHPTAVVCASDEIAAGVMAGVQQWGKRVPNDISVVGFEDATFAEFLNPGLTTVNHRGDVLGRALGDLLIELLDDPSSTPRQITLETELVVRASSGRAPG